MRKAVVESSDTPNASYASNRAHFSMKDLPDDVIVRVFSMIRDEDVETAREVCRQWNEIVVAQWEDIWKTRLDGLGIPTINDTSLFGKGYLTLWLDSLSRIYELAQEYRNRQQVGESVRSGQCSRTELRKWQSVSEKCHHHLRGYSKIMCDDYRRACNQTLEQICRNKECRPVSVRDMCADCVHPSKFQWVSKNDVEEIHPEFWLYGPRRDANIQPRSFLDFTGTTRYIRFDDLIKCLEKEEGGETARRVERSLIARNAVRH